MELPLPVTPKKDELSDEHRWWRTVLAPHGRATGREGCRPLLGPKARPEASFWLGRLPRAAPGGCGGRMRTCEWRLQRRRPYHLAITQQIAVSAPATSSTRSRVVPAP